MTRFKLRAFVLWYAIVRLTPCVLCGVTITRSVIAIVSASALPTIAFPQCDGCVLNAPCTYSTGAIPVITTSWVATRSPNASQDASWVVFNGYTVSSLEAINGVCSTTFGSAVSLPTGYTYTIAVTKTVKGVRKTLTGENLSESAAAAFEEFVGFSNCFVVAHIVTPNTPTKAVSDTTTSVKSIPNSGSASSTSPFGSSSTSRAAATTRSLDHESNSKATTVRIAVGVTVSVLGTILTILGGFLILRRRKRARLAKIEEQQQQNQSDTESSSTTYRKPELDTEQRRHEMEAEKERCELEGHSSRLEMDGNESNKVLGGSGCSQELTGVEPSHESGY